MNKKRIVFFVTIALILTGCTKITNNYDEIIDTTMKKNNMTTNTVSTGYELYIPMGVMQINDSQYNQRFKIKNRYVYLYVDTVSYYYKNTLNYKNDGYYNYYYKEVNFNNKNGYVGINKLDNGEYFCEIVYNYSKIEFYADLDDLPIILANSLIIQNSISYNDTLIALELESNAHDEHELKYELKKPKDSESTFSDYLQEYVAEESEDVELPDDN